MALKPCHECGKEISDQAETCPHCGAPVKPMWQEKLEARQKKKEEESALKVGLSVSEYRKRNRKRNLRALGIFFGVILALCIIVIFIPPKKQVSDLQDVPIIPKVSNRTPEGTLERAVEEVVIDVMGRTVNWSGNPATIIEISKTEQLAGPDQGGYLITIEYRADENLTAGMTKDGVIIDAMKFIKKLYADPACSQVKICTLMPYLPLVDKYGNKSEDQIAKISLRRAVAEKIDWENIYQDRFLQILQTEGQLWLHPAMRK